MATATLNKPRKTVTKKRTTQRTRKKPVKKVSNSYAFGIFGLLSLIAFISCIVILWNTNHGFIAFLTATGGGVFILAGLGIMFDDKPESKMGGFVAIAIGAAIAILSVIGTTKSDAEEKARAQARAAKEAAMTPEEKRQRAFDADRTSYGYLLKRAIKETAFDPDALKFQGPTYYKDGVCIQANGKNRFGAYVGWKEYCYIHKDGKWTYSGPN